jgi:hypothetical protein
MSRLVVFNTVRYLLLHRLALAVEEQLHSPASHRIKRAFTMEEISGVGRQLGSFLV